MEAMGGAELLMAAAVTEDQLQEFLDRFRSYGPIPGLLLPFLKSFVPPLPTLVIIALNAAVYGLWLGFLYSWVGLVCGCMASFLLVRKIAGHRVLARWTKKPKVARGIRWVEQNAFRYVFLFSLFPIGPFVVINLAAGLARMRFLPYALALASGKAVMVFTVSCFGYDPSRYWENPSRLLYIALLAVLSFVAAKKLEARYSA
ncbi:TVP38/TMEM64 family protein [Gorillibacterium sp. sgz5001074]|uniref:TVP38/TMEM64 family protein n=1 Tax=Gorillibacterium sp. sgz5001074 TaxID=3446695 RepID=UPI003F6774EC